MPCPSHPPSLHHSNYQIVLQENEKIKYLPFRSLQPVRTSRSTADTRTRSLPQHFCADREEHNYSATISESTPFQLLSLWSVKSS
jgi:hypothetical protein